MEQKQQAFELINLSSVKLKQKETKQETKYRKCLFGEKRKA